MEILQTAHGLLGTELERLTNRLARRQRGGAADSMLQRITPNGIGVGDRLTTFGGIDDQRDFVILDHVDHVGTTLGHLVHAPHRQAGRLDHLGCTRRGNHVKTQLDQIARQLGHQGLVVIAQTDKGTATVGQDFTGAQLGLGKCLAEGVADTHHFTGRLHFRAEDRIDARELGEGEYRFLDTVKVRNDFLGETDFSQGLAGHHPGPEHRQGDADALGDEGHGTRGARIDFDDEDVLALHRHLHVHQADHAEFQGHFLDLVADLVLDMRRQRIRRQRTGRATGMHAGLFDMRHDRADHHGLAAAEGTEIDFDGAVEEVVEQHRAVVGHFHRFAHVALELFFLVDDFHRPTAQHIGRAHHQRITDDLGRRQGLVFAARRGIGRLAQAQTLNHLLEALAVFGAVDRLGAGADNRYTGLFQRATDFQRGLPAVLHDHPLGLLDADDFQHVFQGYRLEIQAVGGVVVGGDGFRVAVDHDGLVPVFTQRQGGVHAAVVELDALADAVRPAAEDHDLVAARRRRLALFLVGRIHIGGVADELGGAGVDALVHRQHFQLVAVATQALLGDAEQLGQTDVGETLALELVHQIAVDADQTQGLDLFLVLDQVFNLHQEPLVDAGQLEHFGNGLAGAEGVSQVPDAVGTRHGQLALEGTCGLRIAQIEHRIEAGHTDLQATQGFLHGLLEGATDGHDLTDRLHLSGQARVGLGKLLEGETRDLGHDIVDGRLERRRGTATGNVVGQLVEGVTHRQLGGDLGDREAGRLGSQRRGTRYPRVHLDHHHAAGVRTDAELHVGAAGFHADLAQYRQRGVTQDLVFLVGQGLCRGDGDRVAGVHTHGVEVLDGANDDAVVLLVADHLHLVFLPADQRLVDQQLVGRRQIDTARTDFFELFTVVGDAATGAAHGEGRPDDAGEADFLEDDIGFFHVMGDAGNRAGQANVFHRLVEARTVFGLVDGVGVGTDHFHTELFQNALLPTMGGQTALNCAL